jgi:outer membrane protein assembly factor BamB
MYNDQNWGHNAEATGPHGDVSVVWERDLDATQVNGSPVLANGQVYVGDGRRSGDNGTLYVLDAMTGETNWTVDFPGPVMSGACVGDNGLVYAGATGTLVAHEQNGNEIYRWDGPSDGFITSPTFADRSPFFGLADSLYRYRARANAREWVTETFGRIPSPPVYADERVYVPSYDGTVYAYNAGNGSEAWTNDLGGRVNGLSMRDGRLYAATETNRLVQLNTQGNTVWEIGTGAAATATPAVTEDSVYVGTRDGALLSRSLDDGFEQWRFTDTGDPITASPVVADGTVYFGCNDNNVYAVSADSGELEWSFETGNDIVDPAPVVSGGMVFIGSRDGKFYALSD